MAQSTSDLTGEILADVARLGRRWLDHAQAAGGELCVDRFVDQTIGRRISADERRLLIMTTSAMDALRQASREGARDDEGIDGQPQPGVFEGARLE
jgi:hypothetical protein